jgi:hypothetical protein
MRKFTVEGGLSIFSRFHMTFLRTILLTATEVGMENMELCFGEEPIFNVLV